MPRARHEQIWLDASNHPARERETKVVGRALPVSNAAMARKRRPRGRDLLAAAVSKTPILTENSKG
jgi:hypothetical protein